jgi:sugar O-acyltransferase (sialic acid O-acetyltransferase NeuD family)
MFVFGASGHAKVVIDAIERSGAGNIRFVCDDAPAKHGGTLMGYAIVGGRAELLERRSDASRGIVAVGDNAIRERIAGWLLQNGCSLATVVHPSATIGREVKLGEGTVVMAGCVINSGATVGRNVIVNTGATIDHDCEIGDTVHVAPGVHLCGHVSVGGETLIGAGATIIPGVRVGSRAVIGAGSTVLADVPDGARAGGSPCRLLT